MWRYNTQNSQHAQKAGGIAKTHLNLAMYFAKVEAHLAFLYKIHPAMKQSSGFILTIEIMDSA